MEEQIVVFTHKHKYCPYVAVIIDTCANGSWKIKKLDTSKRSKKVKIDYVPTWCMDQWELIPKPNVEPSLPCLDAWQKITVEMNK